MSEWEKAAKAVGADCARTVFAKRARRGRGQVEVHLSEAELAAIAAAAFEVGAAFAAKVLGERDA